MDNNFDKLQVMPTDAIHEGITYMKYEWSSQRLILDFKQDFIVS